MSIILTYNPYAGVNAHLNSYLQNPASRWTAFHSLHIADLVRDLDAQLPPGYGVSAEESLQYAQPETYVRPLRIQPDAAVYQSQETKPGQATQTAQATTPYRVGIAQDIVPLKRSLTAAEVYKFADEPDMRLVTRIELLSPANLPGGSYHERYLQRRGETVRNGVHLVEIDYLHQYQPVMPEARSYADGEADAYPFVIAVTHALPTPETAKTHYYGAHVDEPLPRILLPLLLPDFIVFDMNSPYNLTATGTRRLREASDYSQLPLAFERYSSEDQARIRARMAALAAEHTKQSGGV